MLYLAFDIVNKVMVSFNGSALTVPPIFQTNNVDCTLQFVTPQPGGYAAVDVSAQAPRMTIAYKITGTEGDAATYMLAQAVEAAWTWDANNLQFTGSINLNTAQVQTFLGSNSSGQVYLEINLTTGGADPETIYQGQCTLYANADEDGPMPVTPVNGTGGTLTLQNGVGGVAIAGTVVTVTGMNWGAVPNAVLVMVHESGAGVGVIFANYIVGTATQAQFQFELSGVPPNNNYKFTYIPVFNAPVF